MGDGLAVAVGIVAVGQGAARPGKGEDRGSDPAEPVIFAADALAREAVEPRFGHDAAKVERCSGCSRCQMIRYCAPRIRVG